MVPSIRQVRGKARTISSRSLRLEQLECRQMLDGGGLLVPDHFDLQQNGQQIELDVLANDQFDDDYQGDRLITSVSFGSEGGRIDIGAGGQSVLYTPPADFAGTETFTYAVDGTLTGQVSVAIKAPLAFDDYEIPPDGVTRELTVLDNDPFWAGYSGPRLITSVSVGSAGGTVEIAPGSQSILYTPSEGHHQKETFIYVVDDLYPAQVTVEIPTTLKPDSYGFVQHEPPAVLNVLANDPFWPSYSGEREITHVTESQLGATIEISADGKSITYTQPDEIPNYSYDSFRYVVDGQYEAHVSVRLYRPVRDDSFEVDRNSTEFFYDVTLNDTYRPSGSHEIDVIDVVTDVSQPESGGTVTISPNGLGILYTPPVGFYGSDTFTYVADGVHEANVHVNVTRPVRDDSVSSGVYQDTPDNVINVLANDFIGNGYAGARLITEVTETEQGGVISIRDDGRAILYTPPAGYTGQDRFSYTVDDDLQADVVLNVTPLASNDSERICADPNHGAYVLMPLENDHFDRGYLGPGNITGVEIVNGDGEVAVGSEETLLFTPHHVGGYTLRYTVDGEYRADVSINIKNHLRNDYLIVDQNSLGQSIHVKANDFRYQSSNTPCRNQDYPGPRRITGVTQSDEGGTVTLDANGTTVNYIPPVDFYGTDRFTYTVDDFMSATVTVQVIRRVRDDVFRVDSADGTQSLPVLVNDLFGADYAGVGQLTHVTAAGGGEAVISADGHSILYTPASGFSGTDTFTYTVEGVLKAEVSVVVDVDAADRLPTFDSLEDYQQFLIDDALERYQYLFGSPAWTYRFANDVTTTNFDAGPAENRNHSETNVQVAGVDEGDIVEFDPDYVYALTDSDVAIVDAWPADQLHVVSRVDIEGRPLVEFLHGDRLTVISETGGGYPIVPWDFGGSLDVRFIDSFWPGPYEPLPSTTYVTVIDVADRANPTIVQRTSLEGRYIDSRGIGDYVYLLVSNDAVAPRPEIIDDDNDPTTLGRYETQEEYLARVTANPGTFVEDTLPNYTSYGPDGEMARTGLLNLPEDIYRPIVADASNLISVVSVNVESDEPGLADTSAVYSTGASTIYASLENFYVFDTDYSDEDGAVTRIVKFDWDSETGGVEFAATTTVAGTILNQFSADENGEFLRIATTASNSSSGNWTGRDENLMFVLQDDDGVFEFVGSLQNLALNETMRSVRFLGDRAFITTYRNVDPLFALDLTDPTDPQSVGHITLPGFTSYMHLVDENHLLTVGRNTPGGTAGPTQVSVFDISDMQQPLRTAEYTFPRFSTSEAELDHHAFGYYAEHGLLGMPVAKKYIQRVDNDNDGYRETRLWIREDALAVFSVDTSAPDSADRLQLVSEIEHGLPVRRSGYIGDKLYSVAGDSIKAVDVSDPTTVLAEVVIAQDESPVPVDSDIIRIEPYIPLAQYNLPPREDPYLATIERARGHLASTMGIAAAAPMFVTAEIVPESSGGGSTLVLQVGKDRYAYRANHDGYVEPVAGTFEFDEGAGTWNSAASVTQAAPVGLPGDYDGDGDVDGADFLALQRAHSTGDLAADGNQNGNVDAGDLQTWQTQFVAPAMASAESGDYNRDGKVSGGDFLRWQLSLGSIADTATDGNLNGRVDSGDLQVWQSSFAAAAAASAPNSDIPGDYDGNGKIAGGDFLEWQRSSRSTPELAIWEDQFPDESSIAAAQAPASQLVDAAIELAVRDLASNRNRGDEADVIYEPIPSFRYRALIDATESIASKVSSASVQTRAGRGDVTDRESIDSALGEPLAGPWWQVL